MARILIIVGHPDPSGGRLCRALADAYEKGAIGAGHTTRRFDLALLDVPLLQSQQEFETAGVPESLRPAAEAMLEAEHIVFVFPLWLGTMPALVKAFLEQVMRPGTAFGYPDEKGPGRKLLTGRSARIVVTMGMPGLLYRLWFREHGIAGMRRSILNFVGIKPVRTTYLGLATGSSEKKRAKWLAEMERLGAQAG